MHLIHLGEWDEDKHAAQVESCKIEIRDIYKSAEAMGSLSGETTVDHYTMFEQVYESLPRHLRDQRDLFDEEL